MRARLQDSVKRGADRSPPPVISQRIHTFPANGALGGTVSSVDATARRISRWSCSVSGCQVNLPLVVRRQRLPGVFSSICTVGARAAHTRGMPFGSGVATRPLVSPLGRTIGPGLKGHLLKACHMVSTPASASSATKGPSAVSVPSPANGPGGYYRCIRNRGSLSPEARPAVHHVSPPYEVPPAG